MSRVGRSCARCGAPPWGSCEECYYGHDRTPGGTTVGRFIVILSLLLLAYGGFA